MKLINIPNIITCGNVVCGCMAIAAGLSGFVGLACIFILCGAIFDYFDGMTARALHVSSPIGKELDSLADMVSFGIAPAVLAYCIGLSFKPLSGETAVYCFVFPAIMAAFSALRLAKFNCDERQSMSFIGLPTPANALFWIGFSYFVQIPSIHDYLSSNPIIFGTVYVVLLLGLSVLLISELPMFSLKIKPGHNSFAENKARYIFLAFTVLVLIIAAVLGLQWFWASPFFIISFYILMSIIDNKFIK